MDQRPKHRGKTIKLLEENILKKFHDIVFGNDFLDMTQSTDNNLTDK